MFTARLSADASLGRTVAAYLTGPEAPLPAVLADALSTAEEQVVLDVKRIVDEDRSRRAVLGLGGLPDDAMAGPLRPVGLRIFVDGAVAPPSEVLHARIDSAHVVDGDKVAELSAALTEQAARLACESVPRLIAASATPTLVCPGIDRFCATRDRSGLGGTPTTPDEAACYVLSFYLDEFVTTQKFDRTAQLLRDAGALPADIQSGRDEYDAIFAEYATAYRAMWTRTDVALQWEDLTARAILGGGRLQIDAVTEPFSVHLFRIRR